MGWLGSENGRLMLDWVEAVPRLLEHPELLEGIESEAREIFDRGISDIVWSGMGGSVMAVRVLTDLGFCWEGSGLRIHPLDSTDPAAINSVLEAIATRRQIDLGGTPDLPTLMGGVMMIAVSMGMTSEEPITHLQWFLGLLDEAGLEAKDHVLVITLPGSYLDHIATEREIPRRALQPDGGNGTPGRFSAPGTRVFLLPAALALCGSGAQAGSLRSALARAWNLAHPGAELSESGQSRPDHRAAYLAARAVEGACLLFLRLPGGWEALFPWVEQLMEESLGKGGKGIAVFHHQSAEETDGRIGRAGVVRMQVGVPGTGGPVAIAQTTSGTDLLLGRLGSLAAAMFEWELTTALYGYLEDIVFVGQPAVENYKARARELRQHDDPLQIALDTGASFSYGNVTLVVPAGVSRSTNAIDAYADLLRACEPLTYLDLTVNGELPDAHRAAVEEALRTLGNDILGVPVKLRCAPAAYHSTEQMQMDGVPGVVSLRVVSTRHQSVLLGDYDDRFLKAQAVATWQAMNEAGRPCALLIVDGSSEALGPAVVSFLTDAGRRMGEGEGSPRTD
jgi:hypothetical protein